MKQAKKSQNSNTQEAQILDAHSSAQNEVLQNQSLDFANNSNMLQNQTQSPMQNQAQKDFLSLHSNADFTLIKRLDLEPFIAEFSTFLAREKAIYLSGDLGLYKRVLDELESIVSSSSLPQIPRTTSLDFALLHLSKKGNLALSEIFNISKILHYFSLLQRHSQIPPQSTLKQQLNKIIFPPNLLESLLIFTQKGEIKDGIFPKIDSIKTALLNVASQIKSTLFSLLNSKQLQPYLIDKQVHFIYESQSLLLKAGFSNALNGTILERTQAGYFYVLPSSIKALYEKQNALKDSLEVEIVTICKNLSMLLKTHIPFLRFIDKEFDKFDLLLARINFAKSNDLEFVFPKQHKDSKSDFVPIRLSQFCHPILGNPKALSVDFDKGALILTGVNAGGKTMLLKSILSAAFLAKHLLPMKINPHQSEIPYFKHIYAIISDPQNTKNDISTFAGRMLEFKQNLSKENMLLGIDEIELGTDADEASSLYKILLEELLAKNNKIVLTTHHKRLASLMAGDFRVQMSAALFDINLNKPLFTFLHGSIGKSYAFESAERYGIPALIIAKAKKHYGEDKERLNELIEQSSKLEIELKLKQEEATKELESLHKKTQQYDELIMSLQEQFAKREFALQEAYKEALNTLKQRANTMSEAHRNINNAHKILDNFYENYENIATNKSNEKQAQSHSLSKQAQTKIAQHYKKGDSIKYNGKKGKILDKNDKHFIIELDSGMRLKVQKDSFGGVNALTYKHFSSQKMQKDNTANLINLKKNYTLENVAKGASPSLDLHGFRAEEAIEAMEDFISQSLVAGFDEVAICHGLGGGILAKVTREFLSAHPKVISFSDAPPNMGGMGVKIVRL